MFVGLVVFVSSFVYVSLFAFMRTQAYHGSLVVQRIEIWTAKEALLRMLLHSVSVVESESFSFLFNRLFIRRRA